MDRFLLSGIVSAALMCAATGCSHLMETRTIQRFADSVQSGDMQELKAGTSPGFAEKALRSTESIQDLKILNLPDGKASVVAVEDVSKDRKRVTVEFGDTKKGEVKKEIFYEITRGSNNKWVVNDVYLKQRKRGVEAFKSVTEQMDLLLTVREFLDHWDSGDRDDIFAQTTPEFRDALQKLPPHYLARITAEVVDGKATGSRYKPNAQMDEKTARVKLPRASGELILALDLVDGSWLVKDIAVDTRDVAQQIPSLRNLALSVGTCIDFLASYESVDLPQLKNYASPEFFDGALSVGNLRSVQLPHSSLSDFDLDVKLQGKRADFVLKNDYQIVQINMHEIEEGDLKAPPKYQVSDVTMYDIETKQEKRLAALFTSQAMLELFARSLSERDLTGLRHCSTRDLTQRVWSQLNAATMASMPLDLFDGQELKVVATTFQGSLTRVQTQYGDQAVTYLLREEFGRFYVDDLQWQLPGRPASVKSTMELLIPVANFAAGVAIGRDADEQSTALNLLRRSSSEDFNRMVWSQAEFLPNSGFSADSFLASSIKSMTIAEKSAELQLGDARYGAQVKLIREYDRWLIDEIVLVAGSEAEDRLAVKQTLRNDLARGEARPPEGWSAIAKTEGPQTAAKIQQVSATVESEEATGMDEEDPFAGSVESAHEEILVEDEPGLLPQNDVEPARLLPE